MLNIRQIGVSNLKKSEYRNAVRSRRLICDALLELLDEKPLDKITITDIANRADICRGTFYLHYEKVGDVIGELQDAYIEQLDQYFSELDTPITVDNVMGITAECLKRIYDQNQARYMSLIFYQHLSFADKVCKSLQAKLLEAKGIPQDEQTQNEIVIRSTLLAHGVLGIFHASASGTLNLTITDIMTGVGNFVDDMRHLHMKERHTGGQS